MNDQTDIRVIKKVQKQSKCKKTYSTPIIQKYGEVRIITAGGSTSKKENNGHPDGGRT